MWKILIHVVSLILVLILVFFGRFLSEFFDVSFTAAFGAIVFIVFGALIATLFVAKPNLKDLQEFAGNSTYRSALSLIVFGLVGLLVLGSWYLFKTIVS